jgi:hypothetical protein
VEELLRKLLLSAVVVLIDEGSPLQVTLAVLVSGWAHVLHAMYKPWGAGSVLYGLQHGALFVTSFVFLMGLLFKVDGVSSSSGTYSALSGIMVTLCAAFMAAWVAVIVARVLSLWRSSRSSGVSGSVSLSGSAARKRVSARPGGGVGGVTPADTSSSAADASFRSPSDFVVTNPLRGTLRDSACGVVDEFSPAPVRSSTSTVAASRIERVLVAQLPATSTHGGLSDRKQ